VLYTLTGANVLNEVPGQEGGGMEMGRYSHPLRHQVEKMQLLRTSTTDITITG
jgi:hypothetical protein